MKKKKIVIVGGGAAGYFLAANLNAYKREEVVLLEQAQRSLQKVKISGGGRCNVTHACFDPSELVENYPRGKKELRSLFHKFQPGDTIAWFEERGVELKTENDFRIFPQSNSSQSIVDLLEKEASRNVSIQLQRGVKSVRFHEGEFVIETTNGSLVSEYLILTSGSSKAIWKQLNALGHKIINPVPSLFTFNIPDKKLHQLSGVSLPLAKLSLPELGIQQSGPLLITHWGLSGPSVLKLSAFGARELADKNYRTLLEINWLEKSTREVSDILNSFKIENPRSKLLQKRPFSLSKRLWEYLLTSSDIQKSTWQELSLRELENLSQSLTSQKMKINGKSTFKEEFVTAGGIDLKEVDFRTMKSKKVPKLFFAGEVLDIDAVTGGFNFQACWSEAWVISQYLNSFV